MISVTIMMELLYITYNNDGVVISLTLMMEL